MEVKDKLVVVLSRNYSTGLSVIRSLGAAGYTVDLVASAHKQGVSEIAAKSKYTRNYVEVVSRKLKQGMDQELLEELIRHARDLPEKPLLFPTDDYTASVMDLNRTALSAYYLMPGIIGGGDGSMFAKMDKSYQSTLARESGLMVPEEWIISLRDRVSVPEEVTYPCFCKPMESVTGYKSEMMICRSREELEAHLKKMQKKFAERNVLVQEFLSIDREVDISGVCLDGHIIIPAIIEKTDVAKHEVGVSLAGRIAPFDHLGETGPRILDMMRRLHYFGMFDLELNVVGDKIYFNEINLRSGGPNYSYFRSGANLPALYADEVFTGTHREEDEHVSEYGKTFLYEKVAWEDYMNGFMTKRELKDRLRSTDITILHDENDPEPGILFEKNIREEARNKIRRRRLAALKRELRPADKESGTEDPRLLHLKKAIRKAASLLVLKPLRWIKHTILRYPQMKKCNQRNANTEKPRVLVAGRNYCSNLCMARSLGKAGYEVEILRIFQVKPPLKNPMKKLRPDAYSKYIKAYYVCVSQRDSERIVRRLLRLADPDRKMLLIPADDLVADIADENYNRLKKYYIMPNIKEKKGRISHLMSKKVQKNLAKKFNIPVVNSCVIATENGRYRIPDTVHYPCFIKPNISKNSSKSRMKKCTNQNQLRKTIEKFSRKKDVELLVEDFITIDREFSLLGLSTRDGAMAPGYFVAEKGGHKEHRGVAMTGRLLEVPTESELYQNLMKFVGSLGFEGLFDIDLVRTKEGKLYFLELNLRFGASGYAVTECGVNLPGMFADYMLLHKPVDFTCQIHTPGKTFVSEKIMIDEYVNGFCSREEMEKCMSDADIHFISNDEDPMAYRHFRRFYWVAGIMRRLKKVKNAGASAD